jgi:hypothetical protein
MAGKEASMTVELTEEQRQVVESAETPVRMIDRETKTAYVLVREDFYNRVQSLFEAGPLTEEERRVIIQGVWRRAGWDDPAMDDYAKLDPRAKP